MGTTKDYNTVVEENRRLKKHIKEVDVKYKTLKIDSSLREMELKDNLRSTNKEFSEYRHNHENEIHDLNQSWKKVVRQTEHDLDEVIQYKDQLLKVAEKTDRTQKIEIQKYKTIISDKESEISELNKYIKCLKEELAKCNDLIRVLKNDVGMDYETSGTPSSKSKNRKPVCNGRVKSDRKPGGQKGHKGHSRKKYEPTEIIDLTIPEFENNPRYVRTGVIKKKQRVAFKLETVVTEYHSAEYRDKETGKHIYAPFPSDIQNEVEYDASIKALVLLLSNRCNVSTEKVRDFIKEVSKGTLELSDGFINGVTKKFADLSKAEQDEITRELLKSNVLHVDNTGAKVNGKVENICVVTNETHACFTHTESKGHEAAKNSVLPLFRGTLIHDHDVTFYNYGISHQECLVHVLRYLLASEKIEPERIWNHSMRDLLYEMMKYHKCLNGKKGDLKVIQEYVDRYDSILVQAMNDYEKNPPPECYRDGFNLAKRMQKYKESHLLFLFNPDIPYDNNICERLARTYKRKQQQVITFRSGVNLDYICNTISVLETWRLQKRNLFDSAEKVFRRQKYKTTPNDTSNQKVSDKVA